ncbi:MAG TPA: peptidoglycan-binding protein [Candidatus Limnocylindrales bacterium]|nr:peptidoglycan-binding protein [Candidatus Limnocylindrales bacterium]
MATQYTVKAGDCISSIADQFGFFPDTLWNHPSNASLKSKRKNPNALAENDTVQIPDVRDKKFQGATGKRHMFKRLGVPAKFRLRLQEGGVALANLDYSISIDGVMQSGKTDDDGVLVISIPPSAKKGHLVVETTPEPTSYDLDLGALPPGDSISGVKARLNNLGFDCGPVDDSVTDQFKAAVSAFQASQGIKVTGEADDATKQKVLALHDQP